MRTLGLSAVAAAIVSSAIAADDDASLYRITTKRDDDRVAVKVQKDQATISIESSSGISHAVIESRTGMWPELVMLQLRVKNLENFKLITRNVKLEGAVSIQNGRPHVTLWKDQRELEPLNEASPYWIQVQIVDRGSPATQLPLTDGYFELKLPRTLLQNQAEVTVNWIDFYRG